MADPISITTAIFTLSAAFADLWRLGRDVGQAQAVLLELEQDVDGALKVIRHALDVLRALDEFRERDELHELHALHPVTSDRIGGVDIYEELRTNIQRLYPAITAVLHRIRELAGPPGHGIELRNRIRAVLVLPQLRQCHEDISNRMRGFDRLQHALAK